MSDVVFMKQIVHSQSTMQLYLASQQKIIAGFDNTGMVLDEMQLSENIMVKKPSEVAITSEDIENYKEQDKKEQQAYSQMVLAYRYSTGIAGLPLRCQTAA